MMCLVPEIGAGTYAIHDVVSVTKWIRAVFEGKYLEYNGETSYFFGFTMLLCVRHDVRHEASCIHCIS